MTLGEFIRSRREQQGMTQRQMAACFGVTETTLRNWEGGHSRPRIDLGDVRGFAIVLGCLVSELLDVAEGNLNPAPPTPPASEDLIDGY